MIFNKVCFYIKEEEDEEQTLNGKRSDSESSSGSSGFLLMPEVVSPPCNQALHPKQRDKLLMSLS